MKVSRGKRFWGGVGLAAVGLVVAATSMAPGSLAFSKNNKETQHVTSSVVQAQGPEVVLQVPWGPEKEALGRVDGDEEKVIVALEMTVARLAEKISALTLNFKARATDTDRLFGSVTASDIALAIEQAVGQEIAKRQVDLEHPIRDLGMHKVPVHLMSNIIPEVTVVIEREGEAA